MGKINWVRVILGGVVAGAIINVFEYLVECGRSGKGLGRCYDCAWQNR